MQARRPRPASVLILVIALLVLMALIGTAFISTASIERYSSTQNTCNTEIDLLVQGVLNLAQAPLLRKIQGNGGGFREAAPSTVNTPEQYVPYESPTHDTYLAGRVPAALPNTADPYWEYITAPIGVPTFEAPYAVDTATGSPLPAPLQYTVRSQAYPTSIGVPQPDGTTRSYPALTLTDTSTDDPVNGGRPFTVLAADTDGDGIADAGLVRLPIGQFEGASYYAALRIIDNAAAINTSVAIEANPDTAGGRAVPGDLFPVNLDLKGLLSSGDTLTLLNQYRFNNGPANGGEAYSATPVDDWATPHSELAFNTPYEAFWAQLASRLNNPGYNTAGSKYQAVPIYEGMNLAYHGGALGHPGSSPSAVLETSLPAAMGNASLRIPPFSPGQASTWFTQVYNYNTTGATGAMPLRPLLVVRNPVSDFVPSYFGDQGMYGTAPLGSTYDFGDRVEFQDPNTGHLRGFVCVCPHRAGTQAPMNGAVYNTAFWGAMPWTNHPTRINVNTATFDQLWTAYWSVMQDSPDVNGAYGEAVTDLPAPNNQFRSPIRPGRGSATPLSRSQVIQLRAALAAVNTIDMRDGDEDVTSRTIALTAADGTVVYADVYGAEKQPYITEFMIDFDPAKTPAAQWVAIEIYNPHSTPIPLSNWKLAALDRSSMTLTEIGDFTASMATNPYTHPNGQKGAFIQPGERLVLQNDPKLVPARSSNDLAADWSRRKITPITNTPSAGDANLESAIGRELVLLRPRQSTNVGGASTGSATPGLTPAASVGALTSNSYPQNSFNEGTPAAPNLYDFVPLDSIDLTGIAPPQAANPPPVPPTPPPQPPQRYHYARANAITTDNNSLAWHCVYPGPYIEAPPAGSYRTWGLCNVDAGSNTPDNGCFGAAKQKFTSQPNPGTGNTLSQNATYQTRPLQINNRDSAGPNKLYGENYVTFMGNKNATGAVSMAGTAALAGKNKVQSYWPMSFPYGGFARDGDILQVPFIGSYKLFGAGGRIIEINSITIDSVYAQFLDPSTTPDMPAYEEDMDPSFGTMFHNEQIGHFCPMDYGATDFYDDPADPGFAGNIGKWKYHWAKRLFDYLAVGTPQDAYLPNVDPALDVTGSNSGDPTLAGGAFKYPQVNGVTAPAQVPTAPGALATPGQNQRLQGQQDNVGVEGRININTASWKVLSAVPFYTPGETGAGSYVQANAALAQQIVDWREHVQIPGVHTAPGPFRSIFDLMSVPQFKALNRYWTNNLPGQMSNRFGDLSPFTPALPPLGTAGAKGALLLATPGETDPVDHVFGDVKTRFIALQRISNLVTTRSDSFTVYAQVQGWQNVGSAPNLVATRRAAVLLDRSQVMPQHNSSTGNTLTPMGATNVPND